MKTTNRILAIALLFGLTTSVFAQWNNSGDCRTTGSLYVGNPANNAYSHLTIQGGNQPFGETGKRDLIFNFSGVKSAIRAYRSGSWSSNLEFLTTVTSESLVKRMIMDEYHKTVFFDKTIYIGDPAATNTGEGSKLVFTGVNSNYFTPSIYKYITTSATSGQLRVQIGDFNRDYFNLSIGIKDSEAQNVWRDYLTVLANGNVGIGKNNPQYNLDVKGTIRATEIRVNTGGADFVFENDYKLKPLSEVKSHIKEHKHLPDIPSAAEMQENGVGVSELSTKLLQKVEELTLYVIQQNEIAEQQRKVVDMQQQLIEQLRNELDEIKNNQK